MRKRELSLGWKIGGGFSLLLILTLIAAIIGSWGTSTVLKKREAAFEVKNLMEKSLEGRRAEKNYIIRGDEDYLRQAVEIRDEITSYVEEYLMGMLTSEEDRDQAEQIALNAEEWLQFLQRYAQLDQEQRVQRDNYLAAEAELLDLALLQASEDPTHAQNILPTTTSQQSEADHSEKPTPMLVMTMGLAQREYIANRANSALRDEAYQAVLKAMSEVEERLLHLMTHERPADSTVSIDSMYFALISGRDSFRQIHSLEVGKNDQQEAMETVGRRLLDAATQVADSLAAEAAQVHRGATRTLWGTAVFSIALGALLAVFITRGIITSVAELVEAAETGAEGDLTRLAARKSNDELGRLVASFNKMVGNLRTVVTGVTDSAGEVAAASQQLSGTSEELGASIQQVAATANELASRVQTISSDTQVMATTSVEISDMALKGGEAIDNVGKQSAQLEADVGQLAQVFNNLDQRSQEIGKIIEMIREVAEQTNLLALNAAIEAARAGEYGRGFSVVADEVSNLAERSAEATREIASLIGEMQKDTQRAAAGVAGTVGQAKESTVAILNAAELLKSILHMMESIAEKIQQVALAAEEISGGSQELAASSEEQSASVQEAAAAAQNLSNMAQQLQRLIDHFRI
ncbi:MAG: methyl-accepting chemotaxis protein [Firmicutes bacterium]|nr:methyl-accepting chemotaxis protein [Bacillota bacterium]